MSAGVAIRRLAPGLLGLVLVAGVWSAAYADMRAAKFGLDDLDGEERDQIAEMVDALARVEAVMSACVGPQGYDGRLRARIEDCIEDASLARVQTFFDDRLRLYRDTFDAALCEDQELRAQIPELRERMDSVLWRLGMMCTLCLLC